MTIDIASSRDQTLEEKENEKMEKYQELKREIKRLRNLRSINLIPVVVGMLGSVNKELGNSWKNLGLMSELGYCRRQLCQGQKEF